MSRRRAHSYSSSSDDDETPSRQRKHARFDEADVEKRLESLITRIGSNGLQSIEKNLEGLAIVLQTDVTNFRENITKILVKCVRDIPERMTIFSTLIGVLNHTNYSFVGEFVEHLVRSLKDCLKTSQFTIARRIVRFLADLVNCTVVSPESLAMMLENLVDVTGEDAIPQTRADCYTYMVLYALPYVGHALFEKDESRLNDLLTSIETYLSKRSKTHVEGLRVWQSDEPHPQEDYLDSLFAQILNLRRQNWVEKVTWRLHTSFSPVLEQCKPHRMPQVIPPRHDDTCQYPVPWVVFRMFDYTDVAVEGSGMVLPGGHAIERFLVEDQLLMLLETHHLDRKICARSLIDLPCRVKLPLNWILVEVILGEMFRLPRSQHLQIFYGVLFIELCKELADSMPQVLAQAAEVIFERLDTMKFDIVNRFATWFAYHLSNYKFQWSWMDWVEVVEMDKESPKARFVSETLQILTRFSYFDYVKRIVPKEFNRLLPKAPGPINKFAKESTKSHSGASTAHKLTSAIKERCSGKDALELVKEVEGSSKLFSSIQVNLQLDVFFTVLFNSGSKTFSHAFAIIDKYSNVIRALIANSDDQVEVLHILFSVWQEQQQMMVVMVNRLLRDNYIEALAVVKWIYSPEMDDKLTEFYVWEILHQSLSHVGKEMSRIEMDLEEARDRLDRSRSRRHRGSGDDVMDDDDRSESEDDLEEGEGRTAPSKDKVARLEERRSEGIRSQCAVFTLVLHRHIRLLQTLLNPSTERETFRRSALLDRLRQVIFQHHEQVHFYKDNIKTHVFHSDVSDSIQTILHQFCSLRD